MTWRNILIILCISISFGKVYSQSKTGDQVDPRARKLFYEAAIQKRKGSFDLAEILLKKAIGIDSSYIDAWHLLGVVYFNMGEADKEISTFEKLTHVAPDFANTYYNLGMAYLRSGEYEKAKGAFQKFLGFDDITEQYMKYAQKNLRKAEVGAKLKSRPVPFNPVNIGDGINSELDEYWPVLTADQQTLFFTRKRIMDPNERGLYKFNEDIFFSEMGEDTWEEAKLPKGQLNSATNNEGAITISPDGKFIVFTGCQWKDSYGRCDLYYSSFQNGAWTKPENIGPPINTAAKETQPSISFDGKTLYFASDRKGTHGKLDIWMSKLKEDGTWGVPVNLGPNINTDEDDESPFIHPDDQTLYFASFGHDGLGGSDLFVSRKDENGKFGEPVNLGYPINDQTDQYSLFVTVDGKEAYFASEAEGGYGGLDIYRFALHAMVQPKPVAYLKGKVYDAVTLQPLEADVQLLDLEKGDLVVETYSDGVTGEFLVPLQTDKDYAVNASKKGYLFYSDHLPLKDYSSIHPYVIDVPLQPIRKGAKVILKNIFFDFDKYDLKDESIVELKKLISFMEDNPNIKIEISGHTDNKGSDEYNKTLSEQRAKAVYDYLVNKGSISADRLVYKGYGETQPIKTNETEEGRAYNRRTEFKILSL